MFHCLEVSAQDLYNLYSPPILIVLMFTSLLMYNITIKINIFCSEKVDKMPQVL